MTLKDVEPTEKQVILFQQADVGYTTVSPLTGDEQCANCRWFSNRPYPDTESFCRIIEPYPDEIMNTGYCRQWAARPSNDIEDILDAIEDKSLYITPKPLQSGVMDKLRRRNHSKTLFARSSDGMRLGFHITSNGYEDRDIEHVATKALALYVEGCYKETDAGTEYIGDNPLLLWHDDMIPIGDIVHADMQAGFLVEVSRERDTPIARKVWDFWQATAQDGSRQWGTSHRFKPVKMEVIDEKLVYQEITKQETSLLLWQAAANQMTMSEVIEMAKSKDDLLDEIFGVEQAASYFARHAEGLNDLVALLAKNDVESKDVTPESEDKAVTDYSPIIEKIANAFADVSLAQVELDEQMQALKERDTEVNKERDTSLSDMTARLEKVETFMSGTPKSATQLRQSNIDNQAAQKIKDLTPAGEYDDFFGDAKVAKRGGS